MSSYKDNLIERIEDLQKENAKLKNKNIKQTEIQCGYGNCPFTDEFCVSGDCPYDTDNIIETREKKK